MLAFVTSDTADYKRSDPIAEMAIKWAQKRREKIEVFFVIDNNNTVLNILLNDR